IAGRPGIVPALILGYTANESKAGFLGGLLMAFVVGYAVLLVKKLKVPKWMEGLMPVLIIPCVVTFVCGMLFLMIFSPPL
ncbi:PTS fructose transporter subunit IIC, partial [Streptococcus pyogenes]